MQYHVNIFLAFEIRTHPKLPSHHVVFRDCPNLLRYSLMSVDGSIFLSHYIGAFVESMDTLANSPQIIDFL